MGNNDLGRGSLQFFNYDESKSSKSVFSTGTNKIEAVVVTTSPYVPSSDYPEKTHSVTEVTIAGRKAYRVEVELVGGERMLGYLIPLQNTNGKSLAITIYGDPANFYVLGNLLNSFEWID